MSDSGGDSDSEEIFLETQFVPQENDEDTLWQVIEILAERGNKYRVRWEGEDPVTRKPWAPSWVAKHDCTDDLVVAWKLKKLRAKKDKAAKAKAAAAKKKEKRESSKATEKGKGKE